MILSGFYSLSYGVAAEPRGIRVVKVFRSPPFCE